MESSPLVLAHSHARNASNETQKSNPTAASEEHDLAAGEFATAAKGTRDAEALRTLKLLEQHHQKLAELLKFRNAHPIHQPTETPTQPSSSTLALQAPPRPPPSQTGEVAAPRSSSHALVPKQLPQRDVKSSIAKDLASARGIPTNRQRRTVQPPPVVSPQHAEGKVLSPPRSSKTAERNARATQTKDQDRVKNLPPSTSHEKGAEPEMPSKEHAEGAPRNSGRSDETFQRFYATFEGLLSKLSAPLAFAGLPLNLEEAPKPDPVSPKQNPEERATVDPDVTAIFSRAALRAVREEHGPGGGGFGGAESFYVVPTTGGTISYAGILSRAEREAKLAVRDEDQAEDEFVDARETPQARSPRLMRRPHKPGTKTMEELELENEALRTLADDLSIRLHRFEIGAQSSSMALQRSIRAMQSPIASVSAVPSGESERTNALEEQVALGRKEIEKMGRENEKLRIVVGRYRERWEKLKEGARVRRDGGGREEGGEG